MSYPASVPESRPQVGRLTAPLRLTRAVAVSLTCVLGSALAHLAAGGGAPGISPLIGAWLLVLGAGFLLTGRRLSPAGVIALTLLAQAGLHLLWLIFGTEAAASVVVDSTTMVLTHTVAALLTASVASLGEDVWWRLVELTGLRVVSIDPSYRPIVPTVDLPPLPQQAERALGAEWRSGVRRRGPPLPQVR